MNAEKRQQAIRRMKELSGILKEASRAYYAEDREIMSNLEYDALYDELVKLEEETQMVLAGSATTTVGYEAVKLGTEKETVKPLQFSVSGAVGAQFNATKLYAGRVNCL